MVKLGLRLATLDDSSALAAVHVAAFQRAYRGILPDSCLRGFTVEANDRARRFYEAMGYQFDGATKEVETGARLAEIRYRKNLDRGGVDAQRRQSDAVRRRVT